MAELEASQLEGLLQECPSCGGKLEVTGSPKITSGYWEYVLRCGDCGAVVHQAGLREINQTSPEVWQRLKDWSPGGPHRPQKSP